MCMLNSNRNDSHLWHAKKRFLSLKKFVRESRLNVTNRFPVTHYLVALTLCFTCYPALALKEDVTQPVKVDADSVIFNKSEGFAIYEGNVAISQGTLAIRAARIEIRAPENRIERIEATGQPVTFQQQMDDGKLARGEASKVRYLVEEKRLFLDGNAVLSQNNDKFSSNHIEYSIRSGELKAGNKQAPGKDRVRAIFYPSNKVK